MNELSSIFESLFNNNYEGHGIFVQILKEKIDIINFF